MQTILFVVTTYEHIIVEVTQTNLRGAVQMGDRYLTSPKLQRRQERNRKLETQPDSALGNSFLYSRDKEEDSGKKEVRKASARRGSGNIRMGSPHRVTMRSPPRGHSCV